MNTDLSTALQAALKQALVIVAAKAEARGSPQLVWKLQPPQGWTGIYEHRPEIVWGFCELMDRIKRFNALTDTFEQEMPGFLNSTIRTDSITAKCTVYTILTGLISTIWHRHDAFVVNDSILGEVVDELVQSIRTRTITFGYIAPIRDFRLSGADKLTFPNGVRIQRLRESEATRLYGGMFPVFKTSFHPPGQFAFAGEIEQRFAGGDEPLPPASLRTLVSAGIATAEKVMMSHKAGRVLHDWISISFAKPSPTGTLNMAIDAGPRPAKDVYDLTEADVPRIFDRFKSITTAEFPALSTACQRLADSERRTNAVDALMDAVVGLEMLLLGGRDREGLRFRFALNYATLQSDASPTTRRTRFHTALDIYKVRSQVVHAGVLPDKVFKIADERLAIGDVATMAKEMLRTTIDALFALQVPAGAGEREVWFDNFWETGYFGLR